MTNDRVRYLPMTGFVDHDDEAVDDGFDPYLELDPRESRLIHSARHLTGAEIERLLARYDLHRVTRRILDHNEAQDAWGLFEMWSEGMAERGHARRHYTRLEEHRRAHPVHGPVGPPPPMREWDDDDVPF